MPTVALSPIGNGFQFLTAVAVPLNGGKLNTYSAGTTSQLATYTTSVGNVANTNPIILNSDGTPPSEIWLQVGNSYKFVLTDSAGANGRTFDNIPAINDFSASSSATLVGYTQGGSGSVSRTVAQKFQETLSVKDFGAKGDGVTDDSTAFANAFLAASNGALILCPYTASGYLINTGWTFPTNKSIHFLGDGVTLTYGGSGTLMTVLNSSSSATDPLHIIDGFDLVSSVTGTGTGIVISDSISQTVRNCRIRGFNKGISLLNTALWTEQTTLDTIDLWHNNYGIYIDRGGSAYSSFATTNFRRVTVNSMSSASSATPYGIYVSTSASIYRSTLSGVNIFPDKSSSVGFYSNGDVSGARGQLNVENTNVSATSVVAIKFDTSASSNQCDLYCDIRGTIATKVSLPANFTLPGLVVANPATYANARVRKQGVAGYLDSVMDSDLTTLRMAQRVNGSDQWEWRFGTASKTIFPTIKDDSDGVLIALRHVVAGTGQTGTVSSGTTLAVTSTNSLLVAYAAGANVNLTSGYQDGQELLLVFSNANGALPVIKQNNTAGGFLLSGSGDYSPANGGRILLKCVVDRFYEVGRVAA